MGQGEEMKWEILCLTMPSREEFISRLQERLIPQLCHFSGRATFSYLLHDPALSLGANRQIMRERSTGEYICFVDDDDLVSDDYVDRILPLLDGVDYIGFRVQAYENGIPLPGPTYHSLLCGGWFDKTYADGTKSWHRDISHLNPIKRELALAVPMYGGYAEDSRWASELRSLGIVKTEHYIEDVMYHYLSRTDKTDGVIPGPHSNSAGECKFCHSLSTVLVPTGRFCNSCGVFS
jgi:hypothetical protein